MHVAVDRAEHQLALAHPLLLDKVFLQFSDSCLHAFRGLEHKRQNELAGAKFVAHFLHRWEQDVVQYVNGSLVLFLF